MAYAPHKANDIKSMSCPYVYRQNQTLVEKDLAKKDYDYTRWAWYTRPRDTHKAIWSEPYFDKGGGEVMMTTFSLPLFRKHADGEFVGVVTADVILQSMP